MFDDWGGGWDSFDWGGGGGWGGGWGGGSSEPLNVTSPLPTYAEPAQPSDTPNYDMYNPVYSDYYSGINPSPGLPSLYTPFPTSMTVPYRALPEGMGWPVDGGSPTNPFPYAQYVPAQQSYSDIYQPADRGVPNSTIANVPVGGVPVGGVPVDGSQTPEEIRDTANQLREGDPAPLTRSLLSTVGNAGSAGSAGSGYPPYNIFAGATDSYAGPGFTTGNGQPPPRAGGGGPLFNPLGFNYSMANINNTPPGGWIPSGSNNNNNKSSDDKKAGGFNMAETLGKLATSGISSALSAYGPAAQSQSAMMEQQRQMLADASIADNARRAEQTKLFNSASNDYQNIMSPEDRYKRAYGDVITSSNTGNVAHAREMARSGRTYGAAEQRRGNVMQYAAADTAGNAASDNAATTRMKAAGVLSGMYPSTFNPQIASGYGSLANSYGTRAAATSKGIGEMAGLATTGLFNSQFMKNRLNAPTPTTDETS